MSRVRAFHRSALRAIDARLILGSTFSSQRFIALRARAATSAATFGGGRFHVAIQKSFRGRDSRDTQHAPDNDRDGDAGRA